MLWSVCVWRLSLNFFVIKRRRNVGTHQFVSPDFFWGGDEGHWRGGGAVISLIVTSISLGILWSDLCEICLCWQIFIGTGDEARYFPILNPFRLTQLVDCFRCKFLQPYWKCLILASLFSVVQLMWKTASFRVDYGLVSIGALSPIDARDLWVGVHARLHENA